MTSHLVFCLLAAFALQHVCLAEAIPPNLKKTVAFVYAPDQQGRQAPNGTAFFIGHRGTRTPPDKAHIYLVTAGHVLRQGGSGPVFPTVWLRLNTRVGGAEHAELNLSGPNQNVVAFFHPDPTVDLAVIPFLPREDHYDFMWLDSAYLASAADVSSLAVGEGTDVFFIGLFIQNQYNARNLPIVRFGKVALAPGQPVMIDGVTRDLLLVEALAFAGNSGAPVFFNLPGTADRFAPQHGRHQRLAGVVSSRYMHLSPIVIPTAASSAIATSTLGIAAVVPAERLREVLALPEVRAQRGD